jgi:hypothetical protein
MFQNRVPRKICDPKREAYTNKCKKLRNKDLRDFCTSSDIIRAMKNDAISGTYGTEW